MPKSAVIPEKMGGQARNIIFGIPARVAVKGSLSIVQTSHAINAVRSMIGATMNRISKRKDGLHGMAKIRGEMDCA